MIRSLRWMVAAALALLPSVALAQSTLLQGGSWVSGHLPIYVGQTGGQVIVQDAGGASGGGPGIGASELNITARGTGTAPYAGQGTGPNGTVFTIFDAPTTNSTGYHALAFSANAQGGGLISYGAIGAASALPLQFIVNGTTYQFPFTTSGVIGPSSSVIGDAACWNNTAGTLLKDCGAFVTVAGNNTWTGTNNFTGTFQIGGVTQTFPASGNLVGTSDAQTLTNKSIGASQINSGTLSAVVMPAYTGDVTSPAGSIVNTIAANAVTNAKLAAATQNSVKGAATSTAVADLAVPSCSGASNALQWTTNTGFSCGTLGATTAGWGLTLSGGGVFSISTSQPPYGFDVPINLGLTASAGSSNLTINVVGANGSAPSATNPVSVPFRSGTLATGTPVWAAITSALSIVVPSGATLATTNNVPFRLWIFLTYNGGTPQLGVAVCTTAAITYPCTAWENTRVTSTTITGLATSSGVLYATAGVSSDPVRIIGYAEYSAGLATAGAWASTPTTLQLLGPGIKKPGDLVARYYATNGASDSTSATYTPSITPPTSAQGKQAVTSGSITASATANVWRVRGSAQLGASTNSQSGVVYIIQGATGNALSTAMNFYNANTYSTMLGVSYQALTSSVSATSFQVYFTSSSNPGCLNSIGATCTTTILPSKSSTFIEVEEIMGAGPEPANDNIDPGVFSATG